MSNAELYEDQQILAHERQELNNDSIAKSSNSSYHEQNQNDHHIHQNQPQANTNENNSNSLKRNQDLDHLTQHKKDSFIAELQELESKLFHQIILKTELNNQKDQDKKVIKKLASPIIQEIEQINEQIHTIEARINNGLSMTQIQKRQLKQKILGKRMQQLADVKVLCNLYRHHEYRLLLSTLHIVILYQDLDCHEQAITHLQTIKQINSKYANKNPDAQYLHSLILTLLAKSQCEMTLFKDSIDNLNEAIQIQENLHIDSYNVKDFHTLKLTSQVLLRSKKYNEANSFANMALSSAQRLFGKQSIEYVMGLKSLAQTQATQSQFDSALSHINYAIQILEVKLPEKQQTIIDFYSKLTDITLKKLNSTQIIQQKQNHFLPYIECLRKKYQVIENTYGYRDKRSIKDKRHLASSLLKYQHIQQAQQELQDILEIQQIVYGQKSVEVAKTLKLLGSIAMNQNAIGKAQKLLKKSMSIFHDQGQVGSQKQVQAKLLILNGNGKFLNSRS